MELAVVIGLGVTGRAVGAALRARGIAVRAVDDNVTDDMQQWAADHDVDLRPAGEPLGDVLLGAEAVLPAPGLPERHPIFVATARAELPILSEFDLASFWDERPVVAVTGTDGKTTVVTLIERMLNSSGLSAAAVGNTDTPLVEAIDDPATAVFVVEASSFRLGHSRHFAPDVATWLNFGPDHLDAHRSLDSYEAAKASIWARLGSGQLAVANRDDATVMRHARTLDGDVETFGSDSGHHGTRDGELIVAGRSLMPLADLRRSLPHDILNALAAAASALRAGACRASIAEVLRTFEGLPHRVELVAEIDGVRYVDDSKATTPHAAASAIAAFESVVLLAGGRNKDLDLGQLADHADRIRHVVAIGESASQVVGTFAGRVPTTIATSMADAVDAAEAVARQGDVVLLSPACASFDWYRSYGERGQDFARLVRARATETP